MQDDFFAGVEQIDLKLPSGEIKFPIFYRDARFFALVLPANLMKLKRMLPDPRFQPSQVAPGVGSVMLIALEYYDTDIKPYNEFLMGINLNSPYYLPIPGLNLLRQYFSRLFSAYVYHLPVTTELALRGGIDFYNYPKFIADIDFSDSETCLTCDLVRDGEQILTMTGGKIPTGNLGELKFMCNLYQFKQPQIAEFKVNAVEGAFSWLPTNVSWAFNRSNDIGRTWSDLVLGNRAALYVYMPKVQCILYGPENIPIPLLRQVMLTQGFLPEAERAATKKTATRKKAASEKKRS